MSMGAAHRSANRASRVAACAIAFFAAVSPAMADTDGPDYLRVAGVKPGGVVNVRRDPAPSAAKLIALDGTPGLVGLRLADTE